MPVPLHILSDEEQAPEATAEQNMEVECEGDPLPAAGSCPPPLSEVSSETSPCQVKLEQTMASSEPPRPPPAAPKPKKINHSTRLPPAPGSPRTLASAGLPVRGHFHGHALIPGMTESMCIPLHSSLILCHWQLSYSEL